MSKHTLTLSADGNADFNILAPRRDVLSLTTVQVAGTFGGGTVTFQSSLDGTNFTPIKDSSGIVLALTAAEIVNVNLESDPEDPSILRFALTGSTDPSIVITLMRRQ